ncbi:hypothetical protein [Synergistes jonesii]|uniref:hypothetical protein n=1 Tax=Synergistes jonesii TaxID=2754 RepID=UPI00248E0C6B|nr:hypothetical protein [Synergistes jonesii]
MTVNIVRRTERSGTASQAAASVLMENELGVLKDVKKLIVGDGNKKGGYTLTPDNVVAIWPDQSDASSPLSLAWWINRADGSVVKLRLPAGTYNVLNDLTIPANVYLEADKGATIDVVSGKTLTLNCEIGADAQLVFSGEGTAVENYIRRLHINENLISHRRHRWNEARLNGNDGTVSYTETLRRYHIHSKPFDIEPNTVYTIKAWSAGCRGYFVFYDENKQYLRGLAPTQNALQNGYTFTTPEDAKYFAIDSYLPDGASYLITSLRGLGYEHLYKLEKGPVATSFSIAPCDMQEPVYSNSCQPPRNNEEAARQLVSCAESYKGRPWSYDQSWQAEDAYTMDGPPASALFDEQNRGKINCMTLATLALNGINYFQSKYFDRSLPWRGVKYYSWGKYPNHLWFEAFTLWCYENGWEIDPGINYNNLQAGDLVFYGKKEYPAGSTNQWSRQFRYCDHVAIYTGRWAPDPNRGNELHPQSIEVLQTQPIVVNDFIDRVSQSGKEIKMFARMPLETPYTEYDSADTVNNVIYSTYYKPSLWAVGNGLPLKIDIYGRNGALWEIGTIDAGSGADIASPNYIRLKNYTPSDWEYKNKASLNAAGFVAVNRHFYDSELQFIPPPQTEGMAYDRYVFKKSNNTAVSASDMALFNTLTAMQKRGRNTQVAGKFPPGFHSSAHLETVIPSGARLDRLNGKYAYTTDGITWTELPQADQDKLMALRVCDGENNIYIPNGQHVKLMRQTMD